MSSLVRASGGEVSMQASTSVSASSMKAASFGSLGRSWSATLRDCAVGRLGVLLCEGGGDEGRSDPATVAPGMGEQVASDAHGSAARWHGVSGDRGLQSFMGIGDHQLHAAQPTASKLAQEFGPEVSASEGPMSMPRTSRRPPLLTPTATATETMRPA